MSPSPSSLLLSLALLWTPSEGGDLLATPAPAWTGIDWISGGPLSLEALRGRVVLLRFWTAGCAYCTASLPALRDLHRRHRDRGLVVVGIHHPKSAASRDPATVRRAVSALDLDFPIGIDDRWETVRAYGVGTRFRRFTSVSFLIDRGGVIRFVHDGGEIHPGGGGDHVACRAAYTALEEAIESALAEAPPARESHAP